MIDIVVVQFYSETHQHFLPSIPPLVDPCLTARIYKLLWALPIVCFIQIFHQLREFSSDKVKDMKAGSLVRLLFKQFPCKSQGNEPMPPVCHFTLYFQHRNETWIAYISIRKNHKCWSCGKLKYQIWDPPAGFSTDDNAA